MHALLGVGVRLHMIPSARLIYSRTGLLASYFYHHPDPPIPVYWIGGICRGAWRRTPQVTL